MMTVSQLGQQLYAACANIGDIEIEVIATSLNNVTFEKTLLGTYTKVVSVGGSEGNAKIRIEVQA